MKTIKNSKEITTLEVGDKVIFGDLEYEVAMIHGYYLSLKNASKGKVNDEIFKILNISNIDFVKNLGIITLPTNGLFPETRSLEALTAIVSALFKEYEKQNELPKTWEEFCEKCHIKEKEAFINSASDIVGLNDYYPTRKFRLCGGDRNLCTSKQEAEAHLALMQLRQLRKAYVKNWEPDWISDIEPKYNVDLQANDFSIQCWYHMNNPLSFPTEKLANQFLTNFKDLLEIAKPLL